MDKTRQPPDPGKDRSRISSDPEVIIDFIFEEEAFYIAVRNISDRPLYFVKAQFDPPILGIGGQEAVGKLPVFNREYFLVPGKEIVTFLDSSQAYFERKEPTRITIRLTYRDFRGRIYKVEFHHDLEIYQKLIRRL
jgi:hypothetical protein